MPVWKPKKNKIQHLAQTPAPSALSVIYRIENAYFKPVEKSKILRQFAHIGFPLYNSRHIQLIIAKKGAHHDTHSFYPLKSSLQPSRLRRTHFCVARIGLLSTSSEKTLFLPRRCCALLYSMYYLRLAALWQKQFFPLYSMRFQPRYIFIRTGMMALTRKFSSWAQKPIFPNP